MMFSFSVTSDLCGCRSRGSSGRAGHVHTSNSTHVAGFANTPGQAFPSPVFWVPFSYLEAQSSTHIFVAHTYHKRLCKNGAAGWSISACALPGPFVFVGRNLVTLTSACVQWNLTLVAIARVPYSTHTHLSIVLNTFALRFMALPSTFRATP
jgi:hypothetical protein